MGRLGALAAAVMVVAASCRGSQGIGAGVVAIGAGLNGPAGLKAAVNVRGLPRVSALAFDPQGRLWAATANISDRGHDGICTVSAAGAQPVEVVAGLPTPLGLLW